MELFQQRSALPIQRREEGKELGMLRLCRAIQRARNDERGVEATAMIIVIPVLFVLILALIDIGTMISARMTVENVVRDAARHSAADGGNLNPRTNPTGVAWDVVATNTLSASGRCTQSQCTAGQLPVVDCTSITPPGGSSYNSNTANKSGDIITCTVHYPYKPINGPLLSSPIGLGMGAILKPFDISSSARAETGVNG